MRNLLWKFAALIGVAGIGILVVVQVMQGLSANPELASQQTVAASEPQNPPESRADSPLPELPPLETTETVCLGDPFREDDARQPMPTPETENPFEDFPPVDSPVPQRENSRVPQPAPENLPPVERPSSFPEISAKQDPAPVEPTPELPVLIPMKETPNVEAFSEPPPEVPVKTAKAAPPSSTLPATAQEADPFGDPQPQLETPATKPEVVPFDPYEDPGESEPPQEPTLLAPEPPAPGGPMSTFSDEPEPERDEASPEKKDPEPTAAVINEIFLPPPEPAETPEHNAEPTAIETTDADSVPSSPGRANVQILMAPPADGDRVAQTEPMEFADPALPPFPEPAPASETEDPTPAEPAPALPEVKPLPNDGSRSVEPKSTTSPPDDPQCTVPTVAMADPQADPIAPQPPEVPFVDPLDQLTYPPSAPEPGEPNRTIPAGHETPAPKAIRTQTDSNAPAANVTPGPFPAAPKASPFPAERRETPKEADSDTSSESPVPSGPQQPELKIEKTAPPNAVLNQPMIYHILVRNVGESAARQVVVEDRVPKGTRLTGTIPRGEMAEDRLIWRFDSIPPGEEQKIAVRVIPTQEGQIGSVAKVSFVAEVAARTVVAAPRLKLELTGPADAILGDALTYHFELVNEGSGDATKVFLRNILPDGLTHPGGDDLEYEVGTLKAGEKKGIDLTVNAAKAGQFENKAILTAGGGLKAESTVNVKILGDRLTITRTGPKRRYVGRRAEYANTIVNQSEKKVAPVRVVEVVPAGMEFVKASAGGQYNPNERTVSWAIAELGPRKNQQLTLELLAKEEGPQASLVTAFDPNGSRAVVKSETAVDGYTALRLDVREYNDPIDVGEQVGFRVVAANRGTRASSNVVVKLTIPAEMEFVSAKGPADFKREGKILTFNPIASLGAGTELEFDLVLKSTAAGDARLRLEIASDQTEKPLSREEGIRILARRP